MNQAQIIKESNDKFYALVVVVNEDTNEKTVCRSYAGRYFKTERAAMKSTAAHIAKLEA
jgi:hypothetical protein